MTPESAVRKQPRKCCYLNQKSVTITNIPSWESDLFWTGLKFNSGMTTLIIHLSFFSVSHTYTHTHKHARTHKALFQKQHFLAPSVPATCLNKQTGSWRKWKKVYHVWIRLSAVTQQKKKKMGAARACGYFGCVHEFLHLLVRWDTYHTTVTIRVIRGNGNRKLARQESFSVLVRFLHAQVCCSPGFYNH